MNFLKKIFGKKEQPIQSYADFWIWFQQQAPAFFEAVKEHKNIEKKFFDKLSPKLEELKDGYFFVTGMYDDSTAELVLTADGITKNIVFVEELVAAAPDMPNWRITALKPSLGADVGSIQMGGYSFSCDNISFYANELPEYPDEIDIAIVHHDCTGDNRDQLANGTLIFLDNYLGELDFVTNIDHVDIVAPKDAAKDLIPISKLKDFLTWRQKEFVEKYEGVRYNTEKDNYAGMEGELENGNTMIAIFNSDLLHWDGKASHPWVAALAFKYDGSGSNGMPVDEDYAIMNSIEDGMIEELKDVEGYLNIGRETGNGKREIYFACKDFRKPSKLFYKIQQQYKDRFEIAFDIYKDKYWQSFERFNGSP